MPVLTDERRYTNSGSKLVKFSLLSEEKTTKKNLAQNKHKLCIQLFFSYILKITTNKSPPTNP